jgi:predicted ATP-grasp superfamily ATP-dependent carboligase
VSAILVTDGEERAALAIVRSLGRAQHRVFVCSPRKRSLAGGSKFVQDEAEVPSPLASAPAYAQVIRELVSRWKIEVLIPVSEASLLALLPERHQLDALIPFPAFEQFASISDKSVLLNAARDVGIRVPAQHTFFSREEAASAEETRFEFPAVLKPVRSVSLVDGQRTKSAVVHVADQRQMHSALAQIPATAFPAMLQERVVGPGVGVFVLLWGGKLIAQFFHRRIREKPPSGGVSVYRESIGPQSELLERSVALLRRFDWQGVGMMEYKIDRATATPYLMEFNGRFWGSLQLAIDAGVDIPFCSWTRCAVKR